MDSSRHGELPPADLARQHAPDAREEHRSPRAQRGHARVPGQGHDLEARRIEPVRGVFFGGADAGAEADLVELARRDLLDEADDDLVGRVAPAVRVDDLIEDEAETSHAVAADPIGRWGTRQL